MELWVQLSALLALRRLDMLSYSFKRPHMCILPLTVAQSSCIEIHYVLTILWMTFKSFHCVFTQWAWWCIMCILKCRECNCWNCCIDSNQILLKILKVSKYAHWWLHTRSKVCYLWSPCHTLTETYKILHVALNQELTFVLYWASVYNEVGRSSHFHTITHAGMHWN